MLSLTCEVIDWLREPLHRGCHESSCHHHHTEPHVDAVLITHEHFDHFDPARLRALIEVSPAVQVCTCAAVAKRLADLGERVHVLSDGDEATHADWGLRVLDGVLDMEAQRSGNVVRRLTVGESIDL